MAVNTRFQKRLAAEMNSLARQFPVPAAELRKSSAQRKAEANAQKSVFAEETAEAEDARREREREKQTPQQQRPVRSRTPRLAYLPGPDEARALAEKKRLAPETQVQKLRRREAQSKEFYRRNPELEQRCSSKFHRPTV